MAPNGKLVLVDGNIGQLSTATKIAEMAIIKFGSIDVVVNNAGIFFTKPFTDYTPDDFRRLSETNLEGYIYISQLAVKQMLVQKTGGSVTCLTSAMVNHPIARVRASLPMITKGGLEAITLSLAMEYAKRRHSLQRGRSRIRRCTPMLQSLSPMGEILQIQDIVDAVVYLTGARHVTGEVLHVDAGAHTGKW